MEDGWWKTKQDEDLDIHNTDASWPNGGYPFDYAEGQNNMNEEWFVRRQQSDRWTHALRRYPRPAHYVSEICRYSRDEAADLVESKSASQRRFVSNTIPPTKSTG